MTKLKTDDDLSINDGNGRVKENKKHACTISSQVTNGYDVSIDILILSLHYRPSSCFFLFFAFCGDLHFYELRLLESGCERERERERKRETINRDTVECTFIKKTIFNCDRSEIKKKHGCKYIYNLFDPEQKSGSSC